MVEDKEEMAILRKIRDQQSIRVKELESQMNGLIVDNNRYKQELKKTDENLTAARGENRAVLKVNAEIVDTNTGLMNENEGLTVKLAEKDAIVKILIARLRDNCGKTHGHDDERCLRCGRCPITDILRSGYKS